MVEGKTRSGFKFKVDERIGKDWRVISAISLAESEDATEQIKGTTDLVKLVVGSNEKKLIEHIAKKNDGYVPVSAITDELVDILMTVNETKN